MSHVPLPEVKETIPVEEWGGKPIPHVPKECWLLSTGRKSLCSLAWAPFYARGLPEISMFGKALVSRARGLVQQNPKRLVLQIQFYKTGFYKFIIHNEQAPAVPPAPQCLLCRNQWETEPFNMLHIFKIKSITPPHTHTGLVFFFAPRKVGIGVLASLTLSLWSVLNWLSMLVMLISHLFWARDNPVTFLFLWPLPNPVPRTDL